MTRRTTPSFLYPRSKSHRKNPQGPAHNRRRLLIERLENRRVMTITWNLIALAAGTVVGDGADNMPGNSDDETTIAMPANVLAAIEEATQMWDRFLTDNVTLNIEVGWAVNVTANAFSSGQGDNYTFAAVRNALQADQVSADDNTAFANLPAGPDLDLWLNISSDNPNGSGSLTPYLDNNNGANNTTVNVARANAKALGLLAANDNGVDGRLIFNSARSWDFDRTDGIASTSGDLVGTSIHEIGHFLGFDSGADGPDVTDGQSGRPGPFGENQAFSSGTLIFGPTVLDLYRSSPNSIAGAADLDLTADTRVKNFSIDGGTTVLGTFSTGRNNGDGQQASHWFDDSPEIGVLDPTSGLGELNFITPLDIVAFDVIGWNIEPTTLAPNPLVVGTNGDDEFVLSISPNEATQIVVELNGVVIATYGIDDLDSLSVSGLGGSDTLTVNHENGFVQIANLVFDGGTTGSDNDSLIVTGNPLISISRETYIVGASQDAGRWVIDPDGNMGGGAALAASGDELIINFSNLEPVDSDLPAANFDVILTAGSDNGSIVNGGSLNGFTAVQLTDNGGTFETVRFARKNNVRIMGQSGADVFTVDYTAAGGSLLNLSVFGHVGPSVGGQPGDDNAADQFTAIATVEDVFVTFAGQGGSDAFLVGDGDLSKILQPVSIDAGAGNGDSLVVDDAGRNLAVNYTINPTSITIDGETESVADFTGSLEFARINGTQGVNEFRVTPSATTEFFIDGNDPSTPPGDLLEINFAGTTGRQLTRVGSNGMWEFTNRQDVKFEDIERVNFFPITVIGADAGSSSRSAVRVYDAELGDLVTKFFAYGTAFKGGVRVAVGDINDDGVPEIVTAPGAGRSPLVKVFDLLAGAEILDNRIRAYESSFENGVYVATGDVTGDGLTDIVTSPGPGRNVHIRVWENQSPTSPADPFADLQWLGFRAFGGTIQTGATVAAGDLTGDGRAEIVVGSGPGIGPRVRIYDISTIDLVPGGGIDLPNPGFLSLLPFIREIRPFDSRDRGGVFVAVGNVRGSDIAEIIVGNGTGGRGRVEMFNANGTRFKSFNAYANNGNNAAVRVAVTSVDNDVLGEIVTGEGPGGSRRRRAFDADATQVDDIFETDPDFRHGFFVA